VGIPEQAWDQVEDFLTNSPLEGRDPEDIDLVGGIVGGERPSGYSRSPVLWNRFFQELGLRGYFGALDLPQDRPFGAFAEALLAVPGCLDLTVTSPYKATAYESLGALSVETTVSERVRLLGCLNHIVVDPSSGRASVDITDGQGMARALKKRRSLHGARVLLAGAGGAAAAIGYELAREGAVFVIANIVERDARTLASRLEPHVVPPGRVSACGWEAVRSQAQESEVIVSAITSSTPLDAEGVASLPAGCLLADTRYGDRAELVEAAARAGRRCVDGREMLCGQFAAAAETAGSYLGFGEDDVRAAVDSVETWFLSR